MAYRSTKLRSQSGSATGRTTTSRAAAHAVTAHTAVARTAAPRSTTLRSASPRTAPRSTAPRSATSRATARTQRAASNADAPFFGQAASVLQPEYQGEHYQPDMRVLTGGAGVGTAARAASHSQQASSVASTVVKMAAIVIVLVAVLSFVRIALTSSSVTTMIQSDALSAQISEARSAGTSLEMEQSVLKNPSAVRAQAKQLGMTAPSGATTITLEPDVVAIKDGDTLSLSDTIKNVAEVTQEATQ